MADNIEWTHTSAGFTLIEPDEQIGGFCPDDEMETTGNYGLAMGQCCVYGQPAELIALLERMTERLKMIDGGNQG